MTTRKQRTAGNLSDKIDRDLLHDYMWRNSDRNKVWLGRPGELAEDLGIGSATMSIIFREMIVDGRMTKVKGKFYMVDPSVWAWTNRQPDIPESPSLF